MLAALIPAVAEPPELSRLKCAGHHHKGNTSSNALQMEQFLVCQVTSRYNHRCFGSNKHTPHKGESRDITTTILQHRHNNVYKPVRTIITKPDFSKIVIQAITISSEFKQRKIKHDGYTRRKGIPG
jgi:hypothetical protein